MMFGHPIMLWMTLLLVAALIVFLWRAWRRKQELVAQFVHDRLLGRLTATVSRARQKARLALMAVAVTLLGLSLARPQWGFTWEEAKQQGLDIVVAIDTSRSMLAADVTPNRIERSKLAALDLMRVAKTDRMGLVAFAGTAFLQCPLTLDDEAFRQSVMALNVGIIPQGGSSLEAAIRTAMSAFKEDNDNHKILVLFTDGEDHEEGAVDAAKEAAQAGFHIFTVGVGTADGELIRVRDEKGNLTFVKDEDGNVVKSHLNEALLREIASATDKGFYLPLRGATTIETLYTQGLAPFPKTEATTRMVRRYHERFQWPLGLAVLLLIVEMFISDRKRVAAAANVSKSAGAAQASRPRAVAAVTAVAFLAFSPVVLASPGSAQRQFANGNYTGARQEYEALLKKTPDDARLHYNLGEAAYRANDYETATRSFENALRTPDLKLQQQAYYNLGNAQYRAGSAKEEPEQKIAAWEKAVENYESSLKLNPQDEDAKHNLELVRKKLEELKQQQPKDEQKQDDQRPGDKKNDEKQDQDKNQQDQQKKDQQKKDKDDKSKDQQAKDQKSKEKQDESKKQQTDKGKDDKKDDQKKETSEKQTQDQAKGDQKTEGGKSDDKKGKQGEQPKDQQQQPGQAVAAQMGTMSLQDVKQMLDAQKSEERLMLFRPQDQGDPHKRYLKDW